MAPSKRYYDGGLVTNEAVEEKSDKSLKSKKKRGKHGEASLNTYLLDDTSEALLSKKLFGIVPSDAESSEDEVEQHVTDHNEEEQDTTAVWVDDDDFDDVVLPQGKMAAILRRSTDKSIEISGKDYQSRLREAFQRSQNGGKVPTWAKITKKLVPLPSDADNSDDEIETVLHEMVRSTGKYIEKDNLISKGIINTSRLQDITVGHADSKPLRVIRFHRTKPIVITAGESGIVQLYQVDSEVKKEHFMQSVRFKNFPVTSMDILSTGNSVICGSSSQDYLMNYDLVKGSVTQMRLPRSIPRQNVGRFSVSSDGSLLAMAGHSGQVYIISTASMEHVRSLSAPSGVTSLVFMPGTNKELWAMTECGQIAVWQLSSGDIHSFCDEGTVRGTKICISRDGEYVACGSNTGIVNIYDVEMARQKAEPSPLATISNLLTSCESIAFSHDCQITAMSSNVKKNQVKLAHMRSKTVFSNFPQRHEKSLK
uniref:WD_REPEATS_REGION domain-containing protein n=1 Tax=Heterorhabditis bacteriophora TaxID=37862 RepID=A0A1I7XV24_HETBA